MNREDRRLSEAVDKQNAFTTVHQLKIGECFRPQMKRVTKVKRNWRNIYRHERERENIYLNTGRNRRRGNASCIFTCFLWIDISRHLLHSDTSYRERCYESRLSFCLSNFAWKKWKVHRKSLAKVKTMRPRAEREREREKTSDLWKCSPHSWEWQRIFR